MEFEQGDIVLCTVVKIAGTTVFVKIDGIEKRGTIHLSEVAPGRIRNLRDYVVPKKTIVCKILKIAEDHIELSLRRVKEKEKKEILEHSKIEKSYISILKTILKEKTPETIIKIKEKDRIYDFLESSKEDSKDLEKLIGKENSKKVLEILNTQKQKVIILKKEITINTIEPEGLELIKELFKNTKNVGVKYLSAGKYALKAEGNDIKTVDNILKKEIEELEKTAKKLKIEMHSK